MKTKQSVVTYIAASLTVSGLLALCLSTVHAQGGGYGHGGDYKMFPAGVVLYTDKYVGKAKLPGSSHYQKMWLGTGDTLELNRSDPRLSQRDKGVFGWSDWNDEATFVTVAPGWTVTLFADKNYAGSRTTITGPALEYLGYRGMSGRVSSVRVDKRP